VNYRSNEFFDVFSDLFPLFSLRAFLCPDINFFTLHSPVVLFLYLFLWGNNLIAFSMLLTVFFEQTRTAVAVGFLLIFGFVFGGYMVFETLR